MLLHFAGISNEAPRFQKEFQQNSWQRSSLQCIVMNHELINCEDGQTECIDSASKYQTFCTYFDLKPNVECGLRLLVISKNVIWG